MAVIAIEEHFTSPALRKLDRAARRSDPGHARQHGRRRIKDMDEAGIDIAVLSENNPAAHNLDPATSVRSPRRRTIFFTSRSRPIPTRFKGFAALPLPDPKAAADELERGVTKLGLLGAMIMGTTKGHFVDDKKFRPVFERAVEARRAGLYPSVAGEAGDRRGILQGSRAPDFRARRSASASRR